MIGFQRYWQAGTVRIYDLDKLLSSNQAVDMEYGLIKTLKGRTDAGHLGQSLSIVNQELWVGEPMSEKGNR